MVKNLLQNIKQFAAEKPDFPFLIYRDEQYSYARLLNEVRAFANNLEQMGVSSGQRVALLVSNQPEFVVSYYALLSIGAIAVLLPTEATTNQLVSYVRQTQADTIIYHQKFQTKVNEFEIQEHKLSRKIVVGEKSEDAIAFSELLHAPEGQDFQHDIALDHAAVICFATTANGIHRGVVLSQENLLSNTEACQRIYKEFRMRNILGQIPFYRSTAITAILNSTLLAGNSIIIPRPNDRNDLLRTIAKHKVDTIVGPPDLFADLFSQPKQDTESLDSLRLGVVIDGELDTRDLEQWEEESGCTLLESFSRTEVSPFIAMNRNRYDRKPGSLGKPIQNLEYRIVTESGAAVQTGEIGELELRGASVMKGYLDEYSDSPNYKKNWFATGILVSIDRDGFLHYAGEKNSRIYRYGFPVYPHLLEAQIAKHPSVSKATISSLPANNGHQSMKVAILPAGGESLSEETIREYFEKELPRYMVPEKIEILSDAPADHHKP